MKPVFGRFETRLKFNKFGHRLYIILEDSQCYVLNRGLIFCGKPCICKKPEPGEYVVQADVRLDVQVLVEQLDYRNLGGGDGQHVLHAGHPLDLLRQLLYYLKEKYIMYLRFLLVYLYFVALLPLFAPVYN